MYNLLISSIAVLLSAYILPGVHVSGFLVAIITAIFLGIANSFILPILLVLTLPITILTLGLFTFVINGLLVMLVAAIVPGFKVDGFWSAVAFSIVMCFVNLFLQGLF
jgi:putative membrane protein